MEKFRHQSSFKDNLEKKLFNPRNAEGDPNWVTFEICKDLESELSQHPWFVGLVPHGSEMKGYSGESSDQDIVIFVDPDIAEGPRNKIMDLINAKFNLSKRRIISRARKSAEETHGVESISIWPAYIGKSNLEDLIESELHIRPYFSDPLHLSEPRMEQNLPLLFGPFIGPRKEEYRDYVHLVLTKKYGARTRDYFISKMAAHLVAGESWRYGKVTERIPEMQNVTHDEARKIYGESRKQMWEKRIRDILKIPRETTADTQEKF